MDWFTKLEQPSVFIASPGELAALRDSIRQQVEALNRRLADSVRPYAWEFETSRTGFDHWRPLATQIPLPSSRYCVALVCVFGERIGSPVSRAQDFPLEVLGDWGRGEAPEPHLVYPWRRGAEFEGGFALTGTVFEYFVAMAANERRGLPKNGAPPVRLIFHNNTLSPEPDALIEDGSGAAHVGHKAAGARRAADERESQRRQLQNFLRYVRSRNHECSFVASEKETLQETQAFLERVLGLDETLDGFKGLEFYDVKDASVFFGRGALINSALDKFGRLWARDDTVPFLGLFGGSGAGKSSLLRAGLLAHLLKEPWRGYFECADVTANEIAASLEEERPRGDGFAGPLGVVYAKALAAINDAPRARPGAEGTADEGAGPEAAVERIVEALDAAEKGVPAGVHRRLVIGLDQFEQLIDYHAEPDKRSRLEPLFRFFECAAGCGRIGFIYTCQPNRQHLIKQDPVLSALVERGDIVDVLFPTESVEEIVGGLFERARVQVKPEYVKSIYESIIEFIEHAPSQLKASLSSQASLLPLVSLTLSKIYKEAARRGDGWAAAMTPEAVATGGSMPAGGAQQAGLINIKGSIAELAEKALTEARQVPGIDWSDETVGVLLRRLVRIQAGEEERFHLPEGALPARGAARTLSQSLIRYRLLLPTGAGRVRLAHEAIIYYWPLAERWFEQERALLGTAAILSARARRWEREGRHVEALKGLGQEADEAAELLSCWPDVYSPNASVEPREEDRLLCDYAFAAFEALMQPGRLAKGRADGTTGRNFESTHFLTAVSYGRQELARKYLAAEPGAIEHRSSDGANAAYYAAYNDSPVMMELVLSGGAAPDLANKDGWLPVHVAANWGRVAVLDHLVAAGARPGAANIGGVTALHLAAQNGHAGMVSHLISRYGVEPDARSDGGWTPLHLACHFGEGKTVAPLLATGRVNPAQQTDEGWSALHIACRYCGRDVVALLLAYPLTDVRALTTSGWSPLHLAVSGKHVDVVAEVFSDERVERNARTPEGSTALHLAISLEAPHLLELLLRPGAGSDPTLTDDKGETPLYLAASKGYADAAALLLKSGADVNAANGDGWTPLHVAALKGYVTVLRALLAQEETEVDKRDAQSRTPLQLALEAKHTAAAQLLLDAGALVDAPLPENVTHLHVATRIDDEYRVHFLLVNGADPNALDEEGWTPLHVAAEDGFAGVARLLLERGALVDARDASGLTPLHVAAQYGQEAVARVLVGRRAEVAARDSDGWTPLHLAAQNNHWNVVSFLLNSGADIEAVSGSPPLTPLQAAAEVGHADLVTLLLAEGADPHAKNEAKSTPLVLAIRNVQYELALHLLESIGAETTDEELAEVEAALAGSIADRDEQFLSEVGIFVESVYAFVRHRRSADAAAITHLRARLEASADAPWPIPPALDGDWRTPPTEEALTILTELWPKLSLKFSATLDDLDGLRCVTLPFYQETELCEARCRRNGVFAGLLVFLRRGREYEPLWGNSQALHDWNKRWGLQFDTAESVLQYLRFFCSVITGPDGAFVPFENGERLLLSPTANLEDGVAEFLRSLARPMWMRSETPDGDGKWWAVATLIYGNAVFECDFKLGSDGFVDMLEDRPLAGELPALTETFGGGLRLLRAVKVDAGPQVAESPEATGE